MQVSLSTNAAINLFWRISGAAGVDGVCATSGFLGSLLLQKPVSRIYTVPHVKQEIAKEGILSKYLFFATSKDSRVSSRKWFGARW